MAARRQRRILGGLLMRRIARLATLGLLLALGCTTTGTPQGRGQTAPLKVPEKVLAIAFDDIPSQVAATVPLSLTASDGSGLKLVSLQARAVLDDPVAFTELHLSFENPSDRVMEGTFSIVLPQGAAISRFAMKNDAGFQEGEVVEKQQARQAYEDFLHRRQDPALLEQAAGNEFSARVFPIPARAKKELVVSYSQELSKRRPYALPLKGLPEVGNVDVEAYVPGKAAPVLSLKKQGLKPEGDFKVDASLLGERAGVRNGNLVLARVTPIVSSQPEPLAATLLLVDTSASRALGMAEQGRILQRICAGIARSSGAKTPVVVAAYDQAVEPIFEGTAGEFGDEAIGRMRQRLALGASNLEAALAWAGPAARGRGIGRVVLVTDGVPTAGETAGDKLRERAVALKNSGVERLDAVALGGIRDEDLLKSLVNAGLPRGGVVVDGAMTEEEMWRRLNEATRSGIDVKVENAVFTFPSKVDGVQAGDEVLVYANVPEDKPVRISVGGGPAASPDLVKVERPLLERAWVGAKIKSLVERERVEGASAALSKEIVGLSTQYRVLSPKTSLLVLETDWDYQRFGIDRRALADILVADGGRVSLMHRTLPDPPKPVVVATPKTPATPVRSGGGKWKGAATGGGVAPAAKAAPPSKPAAIARELAKLDEGGAMLGAGSAPSRAFGSSPAATAAPMADARPAPDADARKEAESPFDRNQAAPSTPAGAPMQPTGAGPAATATAAPPPPAPAAQGQSGRGYGYTFSDDAPRPSAPPPERDERASSSAARSMPPAASAAPAAEPMAPGGSMLQPRSLPGVADPSGVADDDIEVAKADPYTGLFKTVMEQIARGQVEQAIRTAFEWRKTDPGDVMALVALGEGFEAAGDPAQAARCYGSIIDLFSSRADLRRFAGERLERLALPAALDLAVDTYGKAEVERPDHPASHRLFAYALLKKGEPAKAFDAIVRGLHQSYPPGRFAGVPRILSEDLGLVGAAWAKAEPKRAEEIQTRTRNEGGAIEDEPSIRFVLNWETDANDVDFHIYDGQGGHAFYSQPTLVSGGSLYADVTTGYGPECFTIRGNLSSLAYPYRLQAQYYSRGPMGYGMGKLEIIRHDGRGGLSFEERPFVVMIDHAFVDLGRVNAPTSSRSPWKK
jgi:tetratricopeptide (TPR) repeat protein